MVKVACDLLQLHWESESWAPVKDISFHYVEILFQSSCLEDDFQINVKAAGFPVDNNLWPVYSVSCTKDQKNPSKQKAAAIDAIPALWKMNSQCNRVQMPEKSGLLYTRWELCLWNT